MRAVLQPWREIKNDPRAAAPKYFKIRNKEAQRIALKLNACQRLIMDAHDRQRKAGKPVRLIVLKPRQTGSSTVCEELLFSQTATKRDVESLIIAHDKDSSATLLTISNLFYQEWPEEIQPVRKWDNKNELYFNVPVNAKQLAKSQKRPRGTAALGLNSRLRIETANNTKAGRARTIQNLHCSEFAFWPDPKLAMLSLMQAVPHIPESMIIIESTANGVGNMFYNLYQRAKDGESEFEAVFIPWYIHEEYVYPVAPNFKRTTLEQCFVDKFKLDDKFPEKLVNEKLTWRRWAVEEACDGDEDKFHQEYPADDVEAFVASGLNVFHFENLRDHYMPIVDEVRRDGYIVNDENGEPLYKVVEQRGEIIDNAGELTFEVNHRAELRMYRPPVEGRAYVVTVDPSEGGPLGDRTSMQVLDRETCEQCAVWHGRQDTGRLAHIAVLIAKYYNHAWLMIERNSMGVAVINRAHRLYDKLFRETKMTKAGLKTDYGWRSTKGAKETMLAIAQPYIRKCTALIYHRATVEELLRYIRDEQNKLHGLAFADDNAIAWQIAMYGCERLDYFEEKQEQKERTNLEQFFDELAKPPGQANKRLINNFGRVGVKEPWQRVLADARRLQR